MDNELKELAALAVKNAFYTAFSSLVNAYMAAGAGTVEDLDYMLGDMTSVFGRSMNACNDDFKPNIYMTRRKGDHMFGTASLDSVVDGLGEDQAVEIYMNGVRLFERVGGEWQWRGV